MHISFILIKGQYAADLVSPKISNIWVDYQIKKALSLNDISNCHATF